MNHKKISDTQPNPGWGDLCVDCKHVYRPKEKYTEPFSPDYPCHKKTFVRGQLQVPDLKRYTDGSEDCPKFELAAQPFDGVGHVEGYFFIIVDSNLKLK